MSDVKKKKAIDQLSAFLDLEKHQREPLEAVADQLSVFDIVKPCIIADLKKGVYSRQGISRSYGVTEYRVRALGVKMGIYKNPRPDRRFLPGVRPPDRGKG